MPVLGGEPRRFLPNASGLTWLNDQQVLFAEIKGDAIHMPTRAGLTFGLYVSPATVTVLPVGFDSKS